MSTTSPLTILSLILLTAVGCASATPRLDGKADAGLGSAVDPPASRYATVDEAAIAALAHAAATTRRSDVDRLQVGSVVAVAGGYTWQTPGRNSAARRDDWRPKARLSLTSDHVATFVIHPRTGDRSVDRANEQITRGERRIVDDLDPLHRPIYLLTPSGRVVTYTHGEPVQEIADLRRERRTRVAASQREAEELARDASPDPAAVALAIGAGRP